MSDTAEPKSAAPGQPECIPSTLHTPARIPHSTYRLQMHKDFPFSAAEKIVPYLAKLGIGDAYCSPIFEARPGSTHGYDVVNHDRLNPELGGREAFAPFRAALKNAKMGLLLDIVPNHMGVGNDSEWWQDVLENGRSSRYSGYFDIDWTPLKSEMQHKLLLPILGNQYGVELEDGNIQLKFEDGAPRIAYYDKRMPVAPRTIPLVFPPDQDTAWGVTAELRAVLDGLAQLPPHETRDERLLEERRASLATLKPRLKELLEQPAMAGTLEKAAAAINGTKGEPHSFDRLHELLEQQPYRLASWKTSSEQINYRRFFDVNDLVGLRMENPEVFAATHGLIRELLAADDITGVRIDHCDGMFDPRTYLVRLQELYVAAICFGGKSTEAQQPSGIEQEVEAAAAHEHWTSTGLPLYSVVEKILEPNERLPEDWPVQGTSGYDFVHFANQLFIQPKNEKRFNAIYAEVLGERLRGSRVIYESKLKIMTSSLSSEVHVLTNLLSQLVAVDRRVRDFPDAILDRAIRETIACFSVYRTYIDDNGHYSEHDQTVIQEAVAEAKAKASETDPSVFDYLEETLLAKQRPGFEQDDVYRDAQLYFARKFQQLTGPVMAKSVEDTSFYVYTRFISSNEVGSSMEAFGIEPQVLHQANAERLQATPYTMLTTSTHDTKRSEDVRCRLNVLSEMPDAWAERVRAWQAMNEKHKRKVGKRLAPDNNEEYLIYQTIVGVWPWQEIGTDERPELVKRVQAYMTKALSEAKENVSWVTPNPEYTEAVTGFVAALLTPEGNAETPFVTDLLSFIAPVQQFGGVNSLALAVLKATVPGVPDFYQGNEMWDLSLVDPDNRRPVDYERRAEALDKLIELAKGGTNVGASLLEHFEDGRAKLWVTHATLRARRERLVSFETGAYTPVESSAQQENVFAYLRGEDVLVVLPRFSYSVGEGKPFGLGAAWGDAKLELPASLKNTQGWTNIFTGEPLQPELQTVFASFPVAVFVKG
jgi:(1->4)-alpha-D-glucan 1-alpha-D-glucosylmutase